MSRDFTPANKDGVHSHNALSWALERLKSLYYLATIAIRPTTFVITTLTTTNANWVALATGLTGVLSWKATELNGNDFYYAYVASPGNNFMVGFGVISYDAAPTAIYVKRPGASDITVKLEILTA